MTLLVRIKIKSVNSLVGLSLKSDTCLFARKLRMSVILAHLSQRLRVSYCHQPMSVVRHMSSTIASNDISSKTATPRALIFGQKHCLVDLFQIRSNDDPGVQNGSAAEGSWVQK